MARALDVATVFALQTAFMLLGGAALVSEEGALFLFVGLLAAYEVVFVSRLGQTPGKDRLHVKAAVVGTHDTPALALAVRRAVVPTLAALTLVAFDARVAVTIIAITAGTAVLERDRRSVHDLAGGTWVIAYNAAEEEDLEEIDFEAINRLRRQRRWFRIDDE